MHQIMIYPVALPSDEVLDSLILFTLSWHNSIISPKVGALSAQETHITKACL